MTENDGSFEITEHKDGFWLYDHTRGMNLSMRAKTKQIALTEAVYYYQERLRNVEIELSALRLKVDSFLSQFQDNQNE